MAVDQQINALNRQLGEENAQIGLMAAALDKLRQESASAVQELHRLLAETRPVEKKSKGVNFINTKVFEGCKYTGSTNESVKTVEEVEDLPHQSARRHATSAGYKRRSKRKSRGS